MPISLEQAQALVNAGVRVAAERGYLVTVAVVDDNGIFVAAGRMDGAKIVAFDNARGKAYTAAAYRQSTTGLEHRPAPKTLFYTGENAVNGDRMAMGQGGLPIWRGNELIGAIGVSGAAPHEDEEIAAGALEAEGYGPPDAVVAQRQAMGHSR
jgi:uncharacterized protein GlcG (DUF336 family)